MKRAMGAEHGLLSDEAVTAVQRCSGEFLSFIVSEARSRVVKEGGTKVTYADIMATVAALGFKCAHHSPLAALARQSIACVCLSQAVPRAAQVPYDAAVR